ncbi:helix-turn-helix transcriptional regulator [Rosistilla oblonga]|uniref:helix-turn-helix transcriptional regulator n=1 Tax=Rosistilla oblonga TaxID=2527990 RepID=UPI003A96F4DA
MANATTPVEPARMLDVGGVAAMLGVSERHIYRLADAGKIPRPCKLGGANRWDRLTLEQWVSDGCPPVTRTGGRRR